MHTIKKILLPMHEMHEMQLYVCSLLLVPANGTARTHFCAKDFRSEIYMYNFIYLHTKTLLFLSFILDYLEIDFFECEMKRLITWIITCLVTP